MKKHLPKVPWKGIDFNAEQPEKAARPIESISGGIIIFSREEHPSKSLSGIERREAESFILLSEAQPEKREAGMSVTESGISTDSAPSSETNETTAVRSSESNNPLLSVPPLIPTV